jgi:hypothetical protein
LDGQSYCEFDDNYRKNAATIEYTSSNRRAVASRLGSILSPFAIEFGQQAVREPGL